MTWNHPALAQRALDEGDKEIVWLKSSLVTILTLVNSATPPTLKQIADICERALNKTV
jgi:hypothetical protein